MKRIFLGPILNTLFKPKVRGIENVPLNGAAILASNHLSFSDSIFLPLIVPRRITFFAKSEYFNRKGLKGKVISSFFRLSNQIPINRSNSLSSAGSLKSGLNILREGKLLGIYPEGTRSPDGRLYKGRTGVAKLALMSKAPIIPIGMIGTDKIQPIGQKIPNIGKVLINIGSPMNFSLKLYPRKRCNVLQRYITNKIMKQLVYLTGQEYVDNYANNLKKI